MENLGDQGRNTNHLHQHLIKGFHSRCAGTFVQAVSDAVLRLCPPGTSSRDTGIRFDLTGSGENIFLYFTNDTQDSKRMISPEILTLQSQQKFRILRYYPLLLERWDTVIVYNSHDQGSKVG